MKTIAFAAAMLCSATSMAQDSSAPSGAVMMNEPAVVNPSWYIQPVIVGMKPDAKFGTEKRAWGGGVKLGQPISNMFDVQFGITHVRDNDGPNHYNQTLAGVDFLWMFSRQSVRPFLLFGVGAERDHISNPVREYTDTSPFLTAGIGLQASLNDQWSLQADLRAVRGTMRHDNDWGFNRVTNKYLSIGLNYAFNPPPAPYVAPAPAPVAAPVVEAAPAPAPAPVEPPPPPPARFEKVTLSATELFAFNSAKLAPSQPKLDEIAAALAADTTVNNVVITGYTDRIGSTKYNQKLSERRANSVREYLIGKGIDGSRLKARGMGESNPVVSCHQKKRSALIKCLEPNRRVEVEQITIEKKVQ